MINHTAPAARVINLDESLIALADIADVLPKPKNGRRVSRVTLYRWIGQGLAGAAPLETMRIGNAVYTSREALQRFFDRVSLAKDGHRQGAKVTTSKAGDRANAELAAAGL